MGTEEMSNMMNKVIYSVDGSSAAVAQDDQDKYISVDNQEEYNSRSYLKKNLWRCWELNFS